MQDWQLLQQFIEHDSQTAFSRLVERHLNLVYSTCLREVGDAALAEDVTQIVFLLLAQKAGTLHPETVLAGWLFQTARFAGRNARRQEDKRMQREQKVAEQMMHDTASGAAQDAAVWAEVTPVLHEAMSKLNATDRNAVLLRCFQGHSLRETGLLLGLSEDAAGKRVNRALEKLRRYLNKRRVALSLAALAALLSNHAVQAAPASTTAAVLKACASPSAALASPALGVQVTDLAQGIDRVRRIGTFKIAGLVVCAAVLFEFGSFQLARGWATAPTSEPAQNQVSMREQPNPLPRTNNTGEDMQFKKKVGTALAGAAIAAAMSTSAFADSINAHVSAVDPAAHVITVMEGGKSIPFTVTGDTKYTDTKDREIKFEGDALTVCVDKGFLKDGTRLSITYEKKDTGQIASIVKLRDFRK